MAKISSKWLKLNRTFVIHTKNSGDLKITLNNLLYRHWVVDNRQFQSDLESFLVTEIIIFCRLLSLVMTTSSHINYKDTLYWTAFAQEDFSSRCSEVALKLNNRTRREEASLNSMWVKNHAIKVNELFLFQNAPCVHAVLCYIYSLDEYNQYFVLAVRDEYISTVKGNVSDFWKTLLDILIFGRIILVISVR
jgi:hypothetical protein